MSDVRKDICDLNKIYFDLMKESSDTETRFEADGSFFSLISRADPQEILSVSRSSTMQFSPKNIEHLLSEKERLDELDMVNIKNYDLIQANQSYLSSLRELARKDPSEATIRYGVSRSVAAGIADLGISELLSISKVLKIKLRTQNTKLLSDQIRGVKSSHISKLKISSIFVSEDGK